MPFLTLPTVGDVPVDLNAGSARLEKEEVGERRRAYDGTMHSTIRAFKRRWQVRLSDVPRTTGDSILSVLEGQPPLACSGDLLGGAVDCHAELREVLHPKYAKGEYQRIEFILHEE